MSVFAQIECVDVGSKRRSEKAMGEIKRQETCKGYVRGKFKRMSSRVNLNCGSRCYYASHVERLLTLSLPHFTPAI